jgi:hypothetical protein
MCWKIYIIVVSQEILLIKGYGYGVKCHFQKYFSYTMAVSFYWWRKPEYSKKTTCLPQVDSVLSSTPAMSGIHSISGNRHWLHMHM